MSPGSESWFDRLAAPHTRRQGIKAAAFGAAAAVGASLPFAGSVTKADAANPSDCRKGCVWVANQEYTSEVRTKGANYWGAQGLAAIGNFGLLLGPIVSVLLRHDHQQQADYALQAHRANLAPCFQDFCPGFDPKKPGGPCDGCDPPLYCNPCNTVESGYICCIYEPGDPNNNCCPS